jgi:hypothetical protein
VQTRPDQCWLRRLLQRQACLKTSCRTGRHNKLKVNSSITDTKSTEQSPLQKAVTQETVFLLNLKVIYWVKRKPPLTFFWELKFSPYHQTFIWTYLNILPQELRLLNSFPTKFWLQFSYLPCVQHVLSNSFSAFRIWTKFNYLTIKCTVRTDSVPPTILQIPRSHQGCNPQVFIKMLVMRSFALCCHWLKDEDKKRARNNPNQMCIWLQLTPNHRQQQNQKSKLKRKPELQNSTHPSVIWTHVTTTSTQ